MTTIRAVALAAGVSVGTVSKALNGRYGVSEELRQKILEVAKQLDFQPNPAARSLATAKTQSIGFLIARGRYPLATNPYYSHVWEGALGECLRHGYNLIASLVEVGTGATDLPRLAREHWVDGVIVVGPMPEAVVGHLLRRNARLVVVDPGVPMPDVTVVTMDNEGGAYEATRHLLEFGHRRIGYVAGSLSRLSYRQRLEGYRRAHVDAGLALDETLVVGDDRPPLDQTLELLHSACPPTAILAGNDSRAAQAMRAAAQIGRRVPDDLSVVGFDDLPLAETMNPPLTTVHVPKDELGELAVRLLVEEADAGPGVASHTLPTKLVIRESTARLRELTIEPAGGSA